MVIEILAETGTLGGTYPWHSFLFFTIVSQVNASVSRNKLRTP